MWAFLVLLVPVGSYFDFLSPTPPPASPPRGQDLSALFASFKTCTACIGAGYGWCPLRRKCGGFANKECGVGEAYVAEGAQATPRPKQKQAPSQKRANDMRATFTSFRTCSACVGAGYGWCPLQRRCGGFASRTCGTGPQYVSDAPPPRNGLWVPKKQQRGGDVEEPPAEAEVPEASPPSAAPGLLFARPAMPPAQHIIVKPSGSAGLADSLYNASVSSTSTDDSMGIDELLRLPAAELVSKIIELRSELAAFRQL